MLIKFYNARFSGKFNRFDGPASESFGWDNYNKTYLTYHNWYIDGISFYPDEYFTFLEECGMDINNLTEADKVLITIWAKSRK